MSMSLDYILNKFNLSYDETTKMPIVIPDYGRDQLASLFHELGFEQGVEVGVCDGTYSKILYDANPQLKNLWGIDPFTQLKDYRDYTRKSTIDAYHQKAVDLLGDLPNYHLIEKLSMDAVNDFEDESLDFVYIDANHDFRHVTEDVDSWSKKVRKGGIIAGHDFAKTNGHSRMHVKHVIPVYTSAWNIKPWFVLGNEAVDEGLIRDKSRSWMWVR